jgi:Bacterial phospho-glucose isomerase C-terminal SIS domain
VLDEVLLDDPEALAGSDERGLLRALASAGARVRMAARLAEESGLAALRPDGRPRNILVAGRGPAAGAADLLSAVAGSACPVLALRPTQGAFSGRGIEARWTLPGWTGPLDLLLIADPDGRDPGLSELVEHAYQRGCTVVAVTEPESRLADAARQARGLVLPFAPVPYAGSRAAEPVPWGSAAPEPADEDASALWALLVPLLALTDRIGTAVLPPAAVQSAADRLDEMAERCGPATATYQNPAKTLAVELADTLPLLWSEGGASDAIARRFAVCLAERAARPALHATLPEALTEHRALLAGSLARGGDEEDFFRDRIEEPQALRLRVVLVRDRDDETAAHDATPAHQLARDYDTAISEVNATAESPLERVAQMLALTDFATAYLGLTEGS